MWTAFLFIVISLLRTGNSNGEGDLKIPLCVREPSVTSRVKEPVAGGIPFPRGLLSDPSELSLTDSAGKPIALQFEKLSTWPDGSVKWGLAQFCATVPASGESTYTLQCASRKRKSGIRIDENPDSIFVDTGLLRAEILRQGFDLFHQVWIDGNGDGQYEEDEQILKPWNGNGVLIMTHEGKRMESRLGRVREFAIEESGPLRATILVRGDHRNAEGLSCLEYTARLHFYVGKSFVRIFYTLENPDPFVVEPIRHKKKLKTPPDPQDEKGARHFRFLHLVTALDTGSKAGTDASASGQGVNVRAFGRSTTMSDFTSKNRTTLRIDRAAVSGVDSRMGFFSIFQREGEEAVREKGIQDFWIRAGSSRWGLGVGVRHGWQNFPKGGDVWIAPSQGMGKGAGGAGGTRAVVRVALWPGGGHGPEYFGQYQYGRKGGPYEHMTDRFSLKYYRFGGGRHKTHELLFWFHYADRIEEEERMQAMLNSPLMIEVPAPWIAASGALGFPSVERRKWNRSSLILNLRQAFSRYEQIQEVFWNKRVASAAAFGGKNDFESFRDRIAPRDFKKNGFSFGQAYGWMHFGDILWTDGYASNHYDWPFVFFLSHLRTGERKPWELGIETVRHRIDIDQIHSRPGSPWVGGQIYEKGLHGNHDFACRSTHTWIQGVLLYWALTGDRRALDAAKETGDIYYPAGFARMDREGEIKNWSMTAETRRFGWPVEGLVELYQYTGEERYLALAEKIIRGVIRAEMRQNGGKGYIENTDPAYATGFIFTWNNGILLNAVGKYLYTVEKRPKDIEEMFFRWMNHLTRHAPEKNPILRNFQSKRKGHHPLETVSLWRPANDYNRKGNHFVNGGSSIIHNVFLIDPLAYAYLFSGKKSYLYLADRLFEDTVKFYQHSSRKKKPLDRARSAHWSPISFTLGLYPGTESKINGWLGRHMKVYMGVKASTLEK